MSELDASLSQEVATTGKVPDTYGPTCTCGHCLHVWHKEQDTDHNRQDTDTTPTTLIDWST
jgi:hypothetical protein